MIDLPDDTTPRKRSVTLDRHRTSITLEEPFWLALKDIATQQGMSLHALVEAIDHARSADQNNLSGALRVFVLRHLQAALRDATAPGRTP